jgi:hypothetical protein
LQTGIATMDATKTGLEQTKKAGLVFPTDAAALLFALLIFSVEIFAWNREFLNDPDVYWHRRVAIEWLSFWVGALLAGCITPYGHQYLCRRFMS